VTIPLSTSVLLILLAYGAGYEVARRIYHRSAAPERAPDSISDEEIVREHLAGRYVNALKLYRTRYACGLKDAQRGIQLMATVASKK
jgi:hypothetical protein